MANDVLETSEYDVEYSGYGYEDYYSANGTIDYAQMEYPVDIKNAPLYEVVLKSYLYAMIIFFSLVGNALIIVVVLRHKRMQTTTNFYIVNLAVADIFVTVFCTWVHLVNNLNNRNWVLGRFFCKFNTFSQVFFFVASVLSLTLIAYDRFFGIVFALKAHMTNRKARTSIVLIWFISFIIAAPLLWFREMKERKWLNYTERWCDDAWPIVTKYVASINTTITYMPDRTIYFTFVSCVLYFFPMLVMTVAYSVIIFKLRISTIPGERVDAGFTAQRKTKRKVIAMLVTIMSVFGVCWLPYQIVLLYSELRQNRTELGEWFFTMQFVAGCFAFSNSALNPLIYAGFNENFKQAIMLMKTDIDSWGHRRYSSRANSIPLTSLRFFTNNKFRSKSTYTTTSPSIRTSPLSHSKLALRTRAVSIDSPHSLKNGLTADWYARIKQTAIEESPLLPTLKFEHEWLPVYKVKHLNGIDNRRCASTRENKKDKKDNSNEDEEVMRRHSLCDEVFHSHMKNVLDTC